MNLGQAALAAVGDLIGDDDLFPLESHDYKAAADTDHGRHLRMAALERRHGSARAAAAAAGVKLSTWKSWAGSPKRVPRKLSGLLDAYDDVLQDRRLTSLRGALRSCAAHVCGVIYWGSGTERDPKYLNGKAAGPDGEQGWRCTWLGHGDHPINLSTLIRPWLAGDAAAADRAVTRAADRSEGADILIDGDNVTMEIHL